MIFGKMGCVLFNNNGKVKKMCVLKKGDIFRVPKNTYHTMMPITNYVVYHESKIGPFERFYLGGDGLSGSYSNFLLGRMGVIWIA